MRSAPTGTKWVASVALSGVTLVVWLVIYGDDKACRVFGNGINQRSLSGVVLNVISPSTCSLSFELDEQCAKETCESVSGYLMLSAMSTGLGRVASSLAPPSFEALFCGTPIVSHTVVGVTVTLYSTKKQVPVKCLVTHRGWLIRGDESFLSRVPFEQFQLGLSGCGVLGSDFYSDTICGILITSSVTDILCESDSVNHFMYGQYSLDTQCTLTQRAYIALTEALQLYVCKEIAQRIKTPSQMTELHDCELIGKYVSVIAENMQLEQQDYELAGLSKSLLEPQVAHTTAVCAMKGRFDSELSSLVVVE